MRASRSVDAATHDAARSKSVSKLDLAVIAAVIIGGAVWVERQHRLVIEPPTRAEVVSPAQAAGCPDNENEPYSASCLLFMGTGVGSSTGPRANAAERTTTAIASPPQDPELRAPASGSACPDNDNAPYSANCLRFLSGRYWRANAEPAAPPPFAAPPK